MSKGCLLFAFNNEKIDYVKQAVYCAKKIRKHLNVPVSLVSDIEVDDPVFDKVIAFDKELAYSMKTYRSHTTSFKLSFKNVARIYSYDLTPYDSTLVLDTDVLICNNEIAKCFDSNADLMMYSNAQDVGNYIDKKEFEWISDTGCKFYWATCLYFKKTKTNKLYFDLVQHIYENWGYYKTIYQIQNAVYRNDFAFSIAAHIMNNHSKGDFIGEMPGTLHYSIDKDIIQSINEDDLLFLIHNPQKGKNFFPVRTKNMTVHCMNKFDLDRLI